MFGFGNTTPEVECGVIIDIGSGSVGAAVLISDYEQEAPQILWTHREHVVIAPETNSEISLKHIHTALVNVFLQLGTTGTKKLLEHNQQLKIKFLQVTVSAPWAYTAIKHVTFTDDHPFEINDTLIADLSETAHTQSQEVILKNTLLQENNIAILDSKPIGIVANGYTVERDIEATAREVSLAHLTALTQKKVIDIVADSKNKILPKATIYTHSFMYAYYEVLQQSYPDTKEACLIDVTSEATEMGVIRDGILTHVTHIPYGTYTLARKIAAIGTLPTEEAYAYLKGGTSFVDTKLSTEKKNTLSVVLSLYEEQLATMFKTTGDVLGIPKTLFLHCDLHTETFFRNHIQNAAQTATKMKHVIHPITKNFLGDATQYDTALQLSALYFHKKHQEAVVRSL